MTLNTVYGRLLATFQNRQPAAGSRCLRHIGLSLVVFGLSVSLAAAEPAKRMFNIEANLATQSLTDYARQAHTQLGYDVDIVNDVFTNAVMGEYDSAEALELLLEDTGLEAEYGERGIYIRRVPEREVSGGTEERAPAVAETSSLGYTRTVAAAAQAAVAQGQASQGTEADEDNDEQKRLLDQIIVTGTRIKGVNDKFSPVTQISREEMDLAGFDNLADVFETLPQNFGGGVTPDDPTLAPGSGPGNASVNLRGLGTQATLILLNGNRLASGGAGANFVDVSTIPASAIERVEILTDGASAIYGSDAIAGVVNIILRDDYHGAETRLYGGTITDGGGDQLKAAQTLGWSGDRGHAMVTYEYSVEDELDAKQKDFAVNAIEPTELLPLTQRQSVFASAGANLTDRIKLSVDGYYNDRESEQFTSTRGNFISQSFTKTDVQQYGTAFGLDVVLSDNWEANFTAAYSKSDHFSDNARDSENPFAVGGELKSTVTEVLSLDGTVEGSLFNIGDEAARGVLGFQHRSEKADQFIVRTPLESVLLDSDKSRDVFAVFGELLLPIITDTNRMPGIQNLELTVAARYEDYEDVGSSLDPKVGLAWSPVTGLNVRGTYGTSFRAPRLDQLADLIGVATLSIWVDPDSPDGESVALSIDGFREDLDPEDATTWTAGFDLAPESLDGFSLRVTYFNTEFRDQIGFPSRPLDQDGRFVNVAGLVVRGVSQDSVQDFCARATIGCFDLSDFFPSLGGLSLEDVEVLLDHRLQNLSRSTVAGVDFEASYDFSNASGDWRLSLAGTHLTDFEQQVAPITPVEDRLNTFGNPVELRMRGGVQWRTRAMTTSLNMNYTSDYSDAEVPTGDFRIDSFVTFDTSIRLNLGELGNSTLAERAFLTLSATNFLNEDPPKIGDVPLRTSVFDGANANPAGRTVGLLLTKQF